MFVEYLIISTGTCNEYLSLRRSAETTVAPKNATGQFSNGTHGSGNISYTATEAALRQAETTYFVDEAFDGHPCPYVCTDFYSPCCLIINFDLGKYFKMLTFMNHCLADLYYCKNYLDLELPPGADQPGVRGSSLCWNHCSAIKYVEFSVFAEDLSSMGHYGWLHGDYKFSHIMEPHERTPGFG
ncbi:hypothetical protein HW555_002417 [Spodoptera exigua]|uniref:Uncharacterized protein n=1 Tax=Spodoptera exigua TaxID=7107 RepID=A0A835L7Z9_SPOEX|nr:hypothetical protein HW555_002417 [Spodoptera exigua]